MSVNDEDFEEFGDDVSFAHSPSLRGFIRLALRGRAFPLGLDW